MRNSTARSPGPWRRSVSPLAPRSGDSSTATVVIIGTQAFETTATLTSIQVTSIKVGDTANVLVDGETKSIVGTVSQVGPVQSSDGTYSYPLVVYLPASAAGLFTGSTAAVSVITSEAKNVLALPTSAVETNGTQHYVLVLSGGSLTDKSVKVGLVGYTFTQVTSGLNEGDRVVLADYSEAVPTSTRPPSVGSAARADSAEPVASGEPVASAAAGADSPQAERRHSGADGVAEQHSRVILLIDAANVVGSGRTAGGGPRRSGPIFGGPGAPCG